MTTIGRRDLPEARNLARAFPVITKDELDKYLVGGRIKPFHPGEVYRVLVIEKRKLNVTDVAQRSGISREMLHRILRGDASVTAKTAIGLAKVAGNKPDYWLRVQAIYDLWMERKRKKKTA
jgi:addiction module HigA family antidote